MRTKTPKRELTAREREVLSLMCQDLSVAEIAYELGISMHTVINHRHNVFRQLRVTNAAAAVIKALSDSSLLALGVSSSTPHPIGCQCKDVQCQSMRTGWRS